MSDMNADEEAIARAIVKQQWPDSWWTLVRPSQGTRNPGWIGQSAERRVFVKPVANPAPLARLAALGVAPPVLGQAEIGGQAWVIQPWVDGHSPDREWIRQHAGQVGEVFGRVHADRELTALLGGDRDGVAGEVFREDITSLRERIRRRSKSWFGAGEVQEALARFFDEASAMQPGRVVPTHDEPNTSNMLVEGTRLWLIDWDDVQLADPMRDIGPLLWWYLPEASWEPVLRAAGVPQDAQTRRRVQWYAARISLSVALWHAEQGHDSDHGFLGDFRAAAHGHPNPRGGE